MEPGAIVGGGILVLMLVGAFVLLRAIVRLFTGRGRSLESYVEDDIRPATDRQLEFIDRLIEEREIDPAILEMPSERLTDASKMIEALLACPKRMP